MKLRTKVHPNHKLEFAVTGPDHLVVGGARWLMHKSNLPRIWAHSRFLTKRQADEYILSVEEADTVTMDEIKQMSKKARWYLET